MTGPYPRELQQQRHGVHQSRQLVVAGEKCEVRSRPDGAARTSYRSGTACGDAQTNKQLDTIAPQGSPARRTAPAAPFWRRHHRKSLLLPCVRSAKLPKPRVAGSQHGSLPGMMGGCRSHW